MRLPRTAHTSRPWRIHEIAGDFHGRGRVGAADTGRPRRPRTAGAPVRRRQGRRRPSPLPWRACSSRSAGSSGHCSAGTSPTPASAPGCRRCATGCRRTSARAPAGPTSARFPFTSVYQTHDEWAAEMANRTVHAVMHIGWVPDGAGGYRGQMAVLVKPNGLFGAVYMAGHQALPVPGGVSGAASRDRTRVAGEDRGEERGLTIRCVCRSGNKTRDDRAEPRMIGNRILADGGSRVPEDSCRSSRRGFSAAGHLAGHGGHSPAGPLARGPDPPGGAGHRAAGAARARLPRVLVLLAPPAAGAGRGRVPRGRHRRPRLRPFLQARRRGRVPDARSGGGQRRRSCTPWANSPR